MKQSRGMRLCTHSDGAMHDCTYVNEVNALLEQAYRYAISFVSTTMSEFDRARNCAQYESAVSAVFHREMQRLCELHGLRKPAPKRNGVRKAAA